MTESLNITHTLCLPLKEDQALLAMKKRGFGEGKWNGAGGKIEESESSEEGATRETREEFGIIPKSLKVDVDVDRLEFLKAVKLGGVFARDVANVLKLEIEDGFVNVLADSTKSGSQKTKVDARVGGLDTKNMVMAFNYKFLEDFLNSVDDENIKMSFTDPNSPGVFANPKDKDYLHIIMPVKL